MLTPVEPCPEAHCLRTDPSRRPTDPSAATNGGRSRALRNQACACTFLATVAWAAAGCSSDESDPDPLSHAQAVACDFGSDNTCLEYQRVVAHTVNQFVVLDEARSICAAGWPGGSGKPGSFAEGNCPSSAVLASCRIERGYTELDYYYEGFGDTETRSDPLVPLGDLCARSGGTLQDPLSDSDAVHCQFSAAHACIEYDRTTSTEAGNGTSNFVDLVEARKACSSGWSKTGADPGTFADGPCPADAALLRCQLPLKYLQLQYYYEGFADADADTDAATAQARANCGALDGTAEEPPFENE